ncbi:MAG: hypothetical protein ACREPL_05090 [Rhodanobacteraceae bacterium]
MGIKELIHYAGWLVLVVLAICIAAALGYWGPWYFAWAVGTIMTILVSAFAGVLYDHEAREAGDETPDSER